MASRFKLQIVDRLTSEIVEWEPGLAIEIDFIEDIVKKVLAKGVGFFRSAAHVEHDLRIALEEAFFSLKAKVRPPTGKTE